MGSSSARRGHSTWGNKGSGYSRGKQCGAYLTALGDQRKEIPRRTEGARKGFSRRGGLATVFGKVGSFGYMRRTFPIRGTMVGESAEAGMSSACS